MNVEVITQVSSIDVEVSEPSAAPDVTLDLTLESVVCTVEASPSLVTVDCIPAVSFVPVEVSLQPSAGINCTVETIQPVIDVEIVAGGVGPPGPPGPPGPSGDDSGKNPVFTYSGNRLSRVDYDLGLYKELTYVGNLLGTLEYFDGTTTIIKTFNYTNGRLTSITEA